MLDHEFYVGTLGDLRALPPTSSPVATPIDIIGGTHQSLTGGFTRDVFGHKQSWAWTYPALTIEQSQYVEALRLGMVPRPLYLIDPRRPNRLPRDVAAGGSLTGSPRAFLPTDGAACVWRPMPDIPADPATLPARGLVPGGLEWRLVDIGSSGLELAGQTTARPGSGAGAGASAGRLNIPALPGEELTFSAWLTGPPSVAVGVSGAAFRARDSSVLASAYGANTAPDDGDPGGGSGAGSAAPLPDPDDPVPPPPPSSLTTLDAAGWVEVTATLTCPPDTGFVRLELAALSDEPDVSVYVTALSVARAGELAEVVPGLMVHCDYPDPGGGWRLGGGSAQVVPVEAGDPGYPMFGMVSTALVLTER